MASRAQIDLALAHVQTAHATLLEHLFAIDIDPRGPTRLAGWSVGHLLSHLARNADSVVRRLEGCRMGIAVPQYEGGADGRAAEIERGSTRSAAALLADVAETAAALEATVTQLDEQAFDVISTSVSGVRQDGLTVVRRRAREVTLHHTDLGVGFETHDWPTWLIDELLAASLPILASRSDRSLLAGWLVDRNDAPVLSPWNGGDQAT